MGVLGLAAFLALVAAMAMRTWRALRNMDTLFTSGPWWCAAWVILVCACFGVVLEGPMGAVVFWTMLGVANARLNASTAPGAEEIIEVEADQNLQRTGAPSGV
jgi:hypothetical protein